MLKQSQLALMTTKRKRMQSAASREKEKVCWLIHRKAAYWADLRWMSRHGPESGSAMPSQWQGFGHD